MDSRLMNRWALLLAVQQRLSSGKMCLYETVLALHALRSRFPGTIIPVGFGARTAKDMTEAITGMSSGELWAQSVKIRLLAIIEGVPIGECQPEQEWLDIWMTTATSPSDRVVADITSRELLKSIHNSLGGPYNGIHSLQNAGEAAGHPGEDSDQVVSDVDAADVRADSGDHESVSRAQR